MIELMYSLIIEATEEPDYFGFYSPDLEGFTGIGHSIENRLYTAKWDMKEHIRLLKKKACRFLPRVKIQKLLLKMRKKWLLDLQ
jgi:hypothetical protein